MNGMFRRRGFSIFEVLVGVAVSGILMVMAVGWIHQSMKFGSTIRTRQRHHQNLIQLGWELRNDVRQSESISMDGENRLVLKRDDGTAITYEISGSSMIVEKNGNDGTMAGNTFRLSQYSIAAWDTSEMPGWISLIVSRSPEGVPLAPPDHPEFPSLISDESPVDLHVRASPRGWHSTPGEQGRNESNQEQPE